jgi:hypothetical protein
LPLKLRKLKLGQAGIEILNEDPAKNRYHARIWKIPGRDQYQWK